MTLHRRRPTIAQYRRYWRHAIGACHALDSTRAVARYILCRSHKVWADYCVLPRGQRRTILRAIAVEHAANRALYLHVQTGGR